MGHEGARVLLTGDEHTGPLAAVRSLADAGNEVWLATWPPRTYAARSRRLAGVVVVPDPARSQDAFAGAVADAARRLRADAVLPGTENGLLALAGRDGDFGPGVALGAPPPDVVSRMVDKEALPALAEASGLSTPPTVTVRREELARAAGELTYPAVIKPARTKVMGPEGEVSHGAAHRVDGPEELALAAADLPGDAWLVQPFLRGGLRALAGVAWRGGLVAALHQESLRIWPPDCGISSYARTVAPDRTLERAAGRLLASTGWSGLFQLQFVEHEGRPYLIDVNPRPYGSLALAIAAGMNLPQLWLELLLGSRPAPAAYRIGVRYRVEESDLRALLTEARKGRPRRALAGLVPHARTVHAVFSVRDPGPALETVAKLGRVAAGRRGRRSGSGTGSPSHLDHGWLAAAIPATARRFRVTDPGLVATLAAAGAEIVDTAPDVEIGAPAGEAPVAIVPVGGARLGGGRAWRVIRRLAASGAVRARARIVARGLRLRGYDRAGILLWDLAQDVRLPGVPARRPPRLVERLPQRALVVASRGPAPVTALEAAVADARRALGSPVELIRPRVVGVLVLVTPAAVMRVAVGPAGAEIDGAAAALATLRAADPDAIVTERLPTVLARGRSGLAEWSAERRLPGAQATFPLPAWLLAEAVDFLVALHAVGGGGEMPLTAQAETVSAVCGDDEARELRGLSAGLTEALASLPLGFAHGDFWLRNLLVDGERLVGVVDWDSGGPGRLPLVDLLQLLLVAQAPLRPHDWGPAVVRRLIPWADAGGDDVARAYCRRVGFEPDPRVLRALVAAYWLDRLAYQLLRHPTRARRPEWVERSVSGVLRALRP